MMTDEERAETRRMLCLAALTYRGFEDTLQASPHADRLANGLDRGLAKLADVCGKWERVWGPVAYRAPFSLFDDELMYVVRSKDDEHRYVVAVRGTNPVSAFDWLFGDFWVGEHVSWPYGDRQRSPDAEISLSTLLGLNVLQIMQSPPPPAGILGSLTRRLSEAAGDVLDDVSTLLRPLEGKVAPDLRSARDDVLPLLAQLDTVRRARQRRDPDAHILGLIDDWRSATRQHAFRRLAEAAKPLVKAGSFNVLRFLEGGARLKASFEPGVTLLAFLIEAVKAAGGKKVDVVVTGHSKGGALSSTLALWLADTQGTDHVEKTFQWDPDRAATVRCFSFAGPTAGNDAFATHSNDVIGPRCYRVANTLDIVPHAWAVADLNAIPTLYKQARPPAVLRDLLTDIALQIDKKYTQVGLKVEELPGKEEPALPDFFAQFVHQHLAGYLRAMDLEEQMNVLTFFSPLA